MSALPDRDGDRPVRHLEWRVRLFGAGAILGVAGIYYEAPWMIWIAIGVLAVGLFVRFLPARDVEGDGER